MLRILVECCAQTTKVVVLAYAIDLEVFAIKPETGLCIKFEITEPVVVSTSSTTLPLAISCVRTLYI